MTEQPGPGESHGDAGAELLSSSSDDPTAEERVRTSAAFSGGRDWVRRHRVLLVGCVGVLVVAAGAVTYRNTRPPPVDPVIQVAVLGFSFGGGEFGVDEEGRTRLSFTYQVTTGEDGDVNTVLGVVGPGLIDPSSTVGDVPYGLPGVGELGATVDCTDPGWWDAEDADFQVGVRRTDQYGRVTVGGVPLGDAQIGRWDTAWHDQVIRTCLGSYVRSLPPPSSTTVSSDGSQVLITLTLANPGDHDIQALSTDFASAVLVKPEPWVTVPAGGQATIRVSAVPTDCTGPAALVPAVPDEDGFPTADRGIPVQVSLEAERVDERRGYGWVTLAPAFADEVDAALATLCAAPPG